MNPSESDNDTAPSGASPGEPHLRHDGLHLQPLHSADELAAQAAAEEAAADKPATIEPTQSQTPAEPLTDSRQPDAVTINDDATLKPVDDTDTPAPTGSTLVDSPIQTDDTPNSQPDLSNPNPTDDMPVATTPPDEPQASDDAPLATAPIVVSSDVQASPPAASPLTDSTPATSAAENTNQTPPFVPTDSPITPKKRRKWFKFLAAAIIVIILGGGGTASYMYVKYYQPEHSLETALNNTFQQNQFHATGTISVDPTSAKSTTPAYKINFNGQTDLASKATDLQVNLTIDGVTFPVEARLVNQNLYFKLGDLSTITDLVKSLAPSEAPLVKSLSGELSNKWFEVDSTLLKQFGATCALDTNLNFTQNDIHSLDNDLKQHDFVNIKNHAGVQLNGHPAEEYTLAISDNTLAAFAKNLNQLSSAKALQTCEGKKSNPPFNTQSLADGNTTPIKLWVDKSSNRIVKLTAQVPAKDEQKDHVTGQLTMNLSYGAVSVSTPKNAESALQLIVQLETSLLGASAGPATTTTTLSESL